MFGSTSSRSLKPMPHGFPGVASSINLPNSGWNTGAGLSFALPWSIRSIKVGLFGLTRRSRSEGQALRRLAAGASHRWPAPLECRLGGVRGGLCGCPGRSKPLGTRSGCKSVPDSVTDKRMLVPHLPKVVHPSLCLWHCAIWRAVAVNRITTGLFQALDVSIPRFPMT